MTDEAESNPADEQPITSKEAPAEVRLLTSAGREIILVAAGRIGQDAPGHAGRVIEREKPATVCIDLDAARSRILADESTWESLTIREVIREKLLTALLLNLLLAAFQRKVDETASTMPGDEIYEGFQAAETLAIPAVLADRDLHITYSRASKAIGLGDKLKLFLMAVKRLFRFQKIEDEAISQYSDTDVMSVFFDEVVQLQPQLREPLIEERDRYTAGKIIAAPGDKIVAVLGAGRVQAIKDLLAKQAEVDEDALENELGSAPETSAMGKWAKWIVPILLVLGLLYLGISQGRTFVRENLAFWIAANSIFTGIGAILARGHILTIITAMIVAPFSPLIPAGPGTVAAIVQLIIRPPLVKDFQTFAADVTHPLHWRKNRIMRIFLILVLCGLGSIIGTLLGTSRILFSLFSLD